MEATLESKDWIERNSMLEIPAIAKQLCIRNGTCRSEKIG
jgi:hypothetical protein